ncbi:hypothetical protein Val02_38560 [Virgisporangium aliadipatigenens]|uniref:Nucleoside phosphorylase domain-containing protein n=2 Tax=Virgisporangium aliadipatigenens TaxID=741659 RepID=A0A8J3YN73_9ACTN|nr:hypothetical protein Val02_38560 [Virgisporangium aliadipatigenens]
MTAEKDECEAAQAVGGRAWQRHDVDSDAPYSVREVGRLSIALARPVRPGGRAAAALAARLIERLRPPYVAMSGACSGRPGEVALGDVVVAEHVYAYDEGRVGAAGFEADHRHLPQDRAWVRAAQDFDPTGLPSHCAATQAGALLWFLERLRDGREPRDEPARRRWFPGKAWPAWLDEWAAQGLIERHARHNVLTAKGKGFLERALYDDVDGPARMPFAVKAAPMASGASEVARGGVWEWLAGMGQRGIAALDREAAAVATVAHEHRLPWLVAKGVADHADGRDDGRFRAFAARASAEVLYALLASRVPPVPPAVIPPATPSTMDLPPVPSTVERPVALEGRARRLTGRDKLAFCRQLGDSWRELADALEVPPHAKARFGHGDEPRDLWEWLEMRGRLGELPAALDRICRTDLADPLR